MALERPTAPRLFPSDTLAYARIDDARQFRDLLRQTSMGRMGADPQIKPIVKEFYGTIVDALEEVQQQIGVNLDEILSIGNGELAMALVPTKDRPAFCMLLEAGDEMPVVEILLARLEEVMERQGAVKETKEFAGIKMVAWGDPNRERVQVGYFIDSGCLVLSSLVSQTEVLAKIWTGNGIDFTPLVENRRFTAIMSRCVGAAGERPQASYFVDPIGIVRMSARLSGGGTMVAAVLPVLGVDGIQGIGGSLILQPEDFDSILHTHLLLNSPRKNLMATIRPKSGKTDPEEWVPENAASYFTMNWDFNKTLAAIKKIVDSFQGEGAFQSNVLDQISRQLGIDAQKELLDQLDDRLTLANVFSRPARLNGGSQLSCLHLKDGKEFASTILPKIFETVKKGGNGKFESDTVGSNVVYGWKGGSDGEESESRRGPEAYVTVIDNCLVAADSRKTIEEAIYTKSGQNELLADSVEYKLIRDRIKKQLGDRETSIISYNRPDETFRVFYDLASNPDNKNRLKEASEANPFFRAISNALERNKLPPFEVIAKYLAPTGFFVSEDDSGIHATWFALRRND